MMNKLILTVIFTAFLTGCPAGNSEKVEPQVEAATTTVSAKAEKMVDVAKTSADAIKVQSVIPFKKGSMVALNIRQECKIDKQLPDYLVEYAEDYGVPVVQQPQVSDKTSGRALVLEITNAVSSGNAFIGHRKFTSVAGALYDNGNKQAAFTAARVSSGGFFGGFKGSCSVLGRTVKVLGKDIANWLKNPVDGAHLGDGV
jgi:hypothetical protein